MRLSSRKRDELRDIKIKTGVNLYAPGSCIIEMGNTVVYCTASFESKVPHFAKINGTGWLTAEYSMLPASTHNRNQRDIARGKQSSRSVEIQRLIGRSLRAAIDMKKLGSRQIIIDCDVLQADGGTRCAAINGGYVALHIAVNKLLKDKELHSNPIVNGIAAISCAMYQGMSVLDPDYSEDSACDMDMNFVMTDSLDIIELQGTTEGKPLPSHRIQELQDLAASGIHRVIKSIDEALGN